MTFCLKPIFISNSKRQWNNSFRVMRKTIRILYSANQHLKMHAKLRNFQIYTVLSQNFAQRIYEGWTSASKKLNSERKIFFSIQDETRHRFTFPPRTTKTGQIYKRVIPQVLGIRQHRVVIFEWGETNGKPYNCPSVLPRESFQVTVSGRGTEADT